MKKESLISRIFHWLVLKRGFTQCVNKDSSSEQRNYVLAEETDLLFANAKDVI